MTWHLIDRELEKKLIAIDPKFLQRINEGAVLKNNLRMDTCMMITDHVAVRFEAKDFEDVPEYDPDTWNEYPKVKPPYDVMMRIKMKNGYLRAGYLKKFPDGDSWANPNGVLMCNAENAEIELFRPWED